MLEERMDIQKIWRERENECDTFIVACVLTCARVRTAARHSASLTASVP